MGEAIHVRMYRDEDLPAVLELLQAALGESPLLLRTPDLFRWKHIDNPFGRSVMLVAEVNETIVGLLWEAKVVNTARKIGPVKLIEFRPSGCGAAR